MYGLYRKHELFFSLIWILAYVVFVGLADSISALIGIEKIITAPVCVIFTLFILGFLKRHNLFQRYGICSFDGDLKSYLYFIPLLLIMSVNLWNGITITVSFAETVLFILSMVCVGVMEEIIFRGFLFKAMCKDHVKSAIFISSITFGMGHIVNLLNGKDLISTLLQVCYASAIGFLFTIIFCKGKSLLPCMVTHGVVNSLSLFNVSQSSVMYEIITAAILCVVPVTYALWIFREPSKG